MDKTRSKFKKREKKKDNCYLLILVTSKSFKPLTMRLVETVIENHIIILSWLLILYGQ